MGSDGISRNTGRRADAHVYRDAAEFLADLRTLRESLRSHGDAEIAVLELQDLIRLVDTFRFHLTELTAGRNPAAWNR